MTAVLLAVGDMDLSLRFCECLIRAEVYSEEEEEEGLACLEEERAGEGGGTLGSLVGVWLNYKH